MEEEGQGQHRVACGSLITASSSVTRVAPGGAAPSSSKASRQWMVEASSAVSMAGYYYVNVSPG